VVLHRRGGQTAEDHPGEALRLGDGSGFQFAPAERLLPRLDGRLPGALFRHLLLERLQPAVALPCQLVLQLGQCPRLLAFPVGQARRVLGLLRPSARFQLARRGQGAVDGGAPLGQDGEHRLIEKALENPDQCQKVDDFQAEGGPVEVHGAPVSRKYSSNGLRNSRISTTTST
jgi:hypothetical protein